jgi:hypothetical protein
MGILLQAKLNSIQKNRFNRFEIDELFLSDGVVKIRKTLTPKKRLRPMIFIKDE